jgi:trehalose 6-phosphate phosphatase
MRLPQPLNLIAGEIGLFLDVDGTLLDLAPRPEEVLVSPGLLADLTTAEHALDGALALVSGRPIAVLDSLFAPLQLRAAGVHGAEIRHCPGAAAEILAPRTLPSEAWYRLMDLLGDFPGTYAENKGFSFAVHYPKDVDAKTFAAALSSLMALDPVSGQEMLSGRNVFEIKPRGFDKGTAIERFMAKPPFSGRKPIFIGDDEIDRAGFAVALALGGFAFSVGTELPGLSGAFATPDAVRAWLNGCGR